jgi:hypothetical protein
MLPSLLTLATRHRKKHKADTIPLAACAADDVLPMRKAA